MHVQHRDDEFYIKALTFVCPTTQSSGSWFFDTTRDTLERAAALQTYNYQASQHGYSLHLTGLPPTYTKVAIQYFIQEVLLNWIEAGNAAPTTDILLTKSLQKVHLITTLLANVTFPNIRVNLRNLEDINCPPFYQLCPTTPPWSIIQKALWPASWLADHGLAKKISLTAINRPQQTFFLAAFCCCTINYWLSFFRSLVDRFSLNLKVFFPSTWKSSWEECQGENTCILVHTMLIQVLLQFKFSFSSLFLVFYLFFASTGWAITNNEWITQFKLLSPLYKL